MRFHQLLAVLIICFTFSMGVQAQRFFTTAGKNILGPNGNPFIMRGTNLGNWLVPEGYMFKFKSVNSPRLINEAILELLGPEETTLFWKKYQDSYITAADIHFLKASGMNSIRIPFNYRLFTNENYMGQNNTSQPPQ